MSKKLPRGLTQTDEGQYRLRIASKHTQPGRMYRERLPVGTTRRQAEAYLSQLREADRTGSLIWPNERKHAPEPQRQWTVGGFAIDEYLPHCEAHNQPATVERKRQLLRASAPWFWDCPLESISAQLVKRFQRERKVEGVSDRTVNLEWATIRHLLNHAHENHLIPYPPPKVKDLTQRDKKAARWLSETEATLALENAAERGAVWYAVTLFLLHTGARWGETRELRWVDLDLPGALVHFRAATAKHGRRREIPLLPEVVEALESLPHVSEQVFMRKGRWGADLLLPKGARVDGATYPWEGKDKELHFGPHVFRHTFATWRLRKGVAIAKVSRWLGHSTIKLTVDTYGHIEPAEHVEEIAKSPRPKVKRLRVVGED